MRPLPSQLKPTTFPSFHVGFDHVYHSPNISRQPQAVQFRKARGFFRKNRARIAERLVLGSTLMGKGTVLPSLRLKRYALNFRRKPMLYHLEQIRRKSMSQSQKSTWRMPSGSDTISISIDVHSLSTWLMYRAILFPKDDDCSGPTNCRRCVAFDTQHFCK